MAHKPVSGFYVNIRKAQADGSRFLLGPLHTNNRRAFELVWFFISALPCDGNAQPSINLSAPLPGSVTGTIRRLFRFCNKLHHTRMGRQSRETMYIVGRYRSGQRCNVGIISSLQVVCWWC